MRSGGICQYLSLQAKGSAPTTHSGGSPWRFCSGRAGGAGADRGFRCAPRPAQPQGVPGHTEDMVRPVRAGPSRGDDLLMRRRIRPPAPHSYTTQAVATPWAIQVFPWPARKVILDQVLD